jgi:hypothetical protein
MLDNKGKIANEYNSRTSWHALFSVQLSGDKTLVNTHILGSADEITINFLVKKWGPEILRLVLNTRVPVFGHRGLYVDIPALYCKSAIEFGLYSFDNN